MAVSVINGRDTVGLCLDLLTGKAELHCTSLKSDYCSSCFTLFNWLCNYFHKLNKDNGENM